MTRVSLPHPKTGAKVNGRRWRGRSVGVLLTPITVRHPTTLEALHGRSIAIDGNLELYQFLSIMRTRDGTPLQDSQGRITSHLNGLVFRTTRLIADYEIHPVFVFDGPPPELKWAEIRKRREVREKSQKEYQAAVASGDTSTEFLPSQGRSRHVAPEVLDLEENLAHLGLTRDQLIDVAILVGTDFNEGVKGIGPKTAVKRIREWKSLEGAPAEVSAALPET